MSLLGDLKMYGRFAAGLPAYLRRPITLDNAQGLAKKLLSLREENFLRLVKRGIFEYPKSPYLPLLKMAGCQFGDLEQTVKKEGLEKTLTLLRDEGVYVTFDECKGRTPIIRNGTEVAVSAESFQNPFLKGHFYGESGGSTGAGTRVLHELDHLAVQSAHELICYDAHEAVDLPTVLWRGVLPDASGIDNMLRRSHYGQVPDVWFSQIKPFGWKRSLLKYRAASLMTVVVGRSVGVRLPWPRYTPIPQADVVARRVTEELRRHGKCLVLAPASRALRVCLTAREAGLDLKGAVFRIAGEPITSAKVRGITKTGARVFTTYGFAELARVGMGCRHPQGANDVHLCTGMCAMIPYPRSVPGTGQMVNAFTYTSVLPTSPMILLNTESDDTGIVETRSCGCPLGDLGFTLHLRDIHSYRKLTGEGVSLVGSEMIRILEEILPARFGGSPLDFQLLEEEDKTGFTRIYVLVSPKIQLKDEFRVVETILNAMEQSSVMADCARETWEQAQTLRVRRQEPIWTDGGKLMSLYVAKRHSN